MNASDFKWIFCLFLSGSKVPFRNEQMDTLYVSNGMTDTWSNQIIPFLVVVNCSLELRFVPCDSKTSSILFQSDISEASSLCQESHLSCTHLTPCWTLDYSLLKGNFLLHQKNAYMMLDEANFCNPSEPVSDTDIFTDPVDLTCRTTL